MQKKNGLIFLNAIAERGYTLVEMLVVLSLMGLMLSLSPSAINVVLPGMKLEFARRQLETDIAQARRSAIQKAEFIDLYIDHNSAQYRLSAGNKLLTERQLNSNIRLSVGVSEQATDVEKLLTIFPDGKIEGGSLSLVSGDRSRILTFGRQE